MSTLVTTQAALREHAQQGHDQRNLPKTDQNQLLGYYDPHSLSKGAEEPKLVPLFYPPGLDYPVTEEGVPFWERLENEPLQAYDLFKQYRDLQKFDSYGSRDPSSHRSLTELSGITKEPINSLATLAALFCWDYRAAAYDSWKGQELELRVQQQAADMERYHGTLARRLIQKVEERLEDLELDELTPQMMIEWLRSATQLERISHKLPATAPAALPLTKEEQTRTIVEKAKISRDYSPHNPALNVNNNSGTIQVLVQYTDEWRSS